MKWIKGYRYPRIKLIWKLYMSLYVGINIQSGSPEFFFTCEKFNFPSLLIESRANAVGPMMSAMSAWVYKCVFYCLLIRFLLLQVQVALSYIKMRVHILRCTDESIHILRGFKVSHDWNPRILYKHWNSLYDLSKWRHCRDNVYCFNFLAFHMSYIIFLN